MKIRTCSLFALTAATMLALAVSASANVIISDAFTGSNNADIDGRTPDTTNLPGGTWSKQPFNSSGTFNATVQTDDGDPAPRGQFNAAGNSNGSIAIPITSSGAYTKPTEMTLSADLAMDDSAVTRLALGFYSELPAQADGNVVTDFFTGLEIQNRNFNGTLNGEMRLWENGSVVASSIAYTGTWVPTDYHTLSYTVDTTTGAITDITLEGSTSDYNFTSTAFTDANTAYAVVAVSYTWARDHKGHVDNFLLTEVPEPASLALFGAGAILILRKRR